MKKSVVICLILLSIIFVSLSLATAAVNATSEQAQISKAFSCLESKVNTTAKCSALTPEEKIFSLLAVNRCQAEVLSSSSNNGECWPSGACKVKTTAQAILALDSVGSNTDKAQAWLLNQSKGTTDLSWFLEIESQNATSCLVEYSGITFPISVGSDKRINGSAGTCLSVDQDGYWLRVSPSCFNQEFSVSCDRGFLTTLLFKKADSATVHVSPESSSAAAGGTTSEKVESFCFVENNVCNYEGTLWAASVLDKQDKDVSSYLPYILTFAEDNRALLPEAFLQFINPTEDNRASLLSKQKVKKWWSESGDKLYDTALALYPFQGEDIAEKTNSKEWLLSIQDSNGCWENNVRNTAFVLASLWPKQFSSGSSSGSSTSSTGCIDSGNYCVSSSSSCTSNNGEILNQYDCSSSFYLCCSVKPKESTCSELGGSICSSSQACVGGNEASAAGLSSNQVCCIQGSCTARTEAELSECEGAGGSCSSIGCQSGQKESTFYSCNDSGDSCCMPVSNGSKSYTWIWVLLILIILTVLGILFREKLRMLWFRISSRKKGSGSGSSGPSSSSGGRPSPPFFPRPVFRPAQTTHVIHHTAPAPARRPVPRAKSETQKELDEVLRKLKEMGK